MTIYTKFKFIGLIYSTSKNLELFFNMLLEVPIKCRNLQEQVRKMQFSINTTIFPKDGYKTKRKRKCLSMYIKYDIDCTFMGNTNCGVSNLGIIIRFFFSKYFSLIKVVYMCFRLLQLAHGSCNGHRKKSRFFFLKTSHILAPNYVETVLLY